MLHKACFGNLSYQIGLGIRNIQNFIEAKFILIVCQLDYVNFLGNKIFLVESWGCFLLVAGGHHLVIRFLVQFNVLLQQSVEDGHSLVVKLALLNWLDFVLNFRRRFFKGVADVASDVDVYHRVATLGGYGGCTSNFKWCSRWFKVLCVRMWLSVGALLGVFNLSLGRQQQQRLILWCFDFSRSLVLDNLRWHSGRVRLLALSPNELSLYVHLVYKQLLHQFVF